MFLYSTTVFSLNKKETVKIVKTKQQKRFVFYKEMYK